MYYDFIRLKYFHMTSIVIKLNDHLLYKFYRLSETSMGRKDLPTTKRPIPIIKSVVDYVLVPYEQLLRIDSFEIRLVTDIVNELNMQGNRKEPDHSS